MYGHITDGVKRPAKYTISGVVSLAASLGGFVDMDISIDLSILGSVGLEELYVLVFEEGTLLSVGFGRYGLRRSKNGAHGGLEGDSFHLVLLGCKHICVVTVLLVILD